MECAVCKESVNEFCLVSFDSKTAKTGSEMNKSSWASPLSAGRQSSPDGSIGRSVLQLESSFELGFHDGSAEQGDPFIRASTPRE